MEEANALTYIGQDSYKSGYIAAKILMRNYQAGEGQELVLFLSNNKNSPAEIQMQRRLAGFMSFITEEYEELVIHEVVLNKSNQEIIKRHWMNFSGCIRKLRWVSYSIPEFISWANISVVRDVA